MSRPAMRDWALRLLRLLNERKVLTSRIVAEAFGVDIRTARRHLLVLSDLPCVVADEEAHTFTLTSDYVISEKILNASEVALVCAMIDHAIHIFGKEHTRFLADLKNRIFRMPDVGPFVGEESIDLGKAAAARQALERHVKHREIVSFSYSRTGKRYTVEPYKILYSDGFWYLVGRHGGTVKKFVIDFIGGIRANGRTYAEIPERIRRTLHDARTLRLNEKEPDRVTVAFDAHVAHVFERRCVFPRQEIAGRGGDGSIVVSFDVHNEMDFREQVARWMPYFRVLAPDRYRAYVERVAGECAARHGAEPA